MSGERMSLLGLRGRSGGRTDERTDEWIEELGSRLNVQRKQFTRIMEQIELGQVCRLIAAPKDRLVLASLRLVRGVLCLAWNRTAYREV